MQREVIKWLQTLDLSTPVKNPNRDLANGVAASEIVARYATTAQLPLQSITTEASADSRRHNWQIVVKALDGMGCTTVRADLVDELLRRQPNAGVTVLENMYEFLTQRPLPMRSLNTDEKGRPYITPKTALPANAFLAATEDGGRTRKGMGETAGTQSLTTSTPSPPAAVRLPALNASNAATAARRAMGLGGSAEVTEGGAADVDEEATRQAAQQVQARLALTANHELAAGPVAAKRQPRYAQATATSLMRPANDGRQNVSLAKAKFTPDAARSRERNLQILSEHEAVKDWKGQDARHQTRKAAEEDARRLPLQTGVEDRDVLLTTLLRGPYSTARVGGRRGARRDGTGASGSHDGRGSEAARTRTHTGGGGGGSGRTSTSARGLVEAPQQVRKVQVNVLGAGLLAALARSGAMDANRRVAEERSVEVFRQSALSVRKGISCLLHDVLAAQHELVPLVERCAESGEGDVLEDLLLAVMCHRDSLPMDTLRACWASLEQNVAGIAASICERADEYHALLTALSFAFSLESAQTPLLHVSAETDDADDDDDDDDNADAFNGEGPGLGTRRTMRPIAGAAASASATAMAPRHRSQSVGEALLAATRRHSVSRAGGAAGAEDRTGLAGLTTTGSDGVDTSFPSTRSGVFGSTSFALTNPHDTAAGRQRTVRLDRASFHLASAFVFLSHVGTAVRERDALLAEQLLTQFFLPAAQPALLPHGSTAMVEAVARVLTAHLCGSATTLADSALRESPGGDTAAEVLEELVGSYAYAVQFLSDTLPACLDGALAGDSLPTHSTRSSSDVGAARCHREAFHRYLYHTVRQLVSRVIEARAMIEEAAVASPAHNEAALTAFTAAVQTLTDSLFTQLQPSLVSCLAQPGEGDRAVAVSLLAQLATLIIDAPTTAAEAIAADAAKRTVLYWARQWIVDVVLQRGVAAFFPSAFEASGWELRVVTLELLTLLHRKMLTWRVSLAELGASAGDGAAVPSPAEYDGCLSPPRLERATVAVLQLFARSPPRQRQLALTVVGRRLLPDTQPRVALAWLECLLGFPSPLFRACLLPYDVSPRRMRRLTAAPLDSLVAGSARRAGEAPSLGQAGVVAEMVAPVDMSSIQMLLGRVEPEYVIAPLNQTWDTCSVVQTVLRHASRLTRDQVLAVVAAALLSPQPLETQREQLAHNVAQLTTATTLVELSPDEDEESREGGTPAGDDDEEDGEDNATWTTTLRDLAGTTSRGPPLSREPDAQSQASAVAGAADGAASATAMEEHFWLATLQTVLPLIESILFDSPAEPLPQDTLPTSDDAKQTAAAVLFTLFQRYAGDAYLQGDMDGQALLQRSIHWASTV